MAEWSILVDGVSLNSLVRQVDVYEPQPAKRRVNDLEVAYLHGEIAVEGAYEPALYSISLWVDGVNSSGVVPSGVDPEGLLQTNLEIVQGLFEPAIITITETPPGGATRVSKVKVVAKSVAAEGSRAKRLTFGLKRVEAFSEGSSSTTHTFTSVGAWETLSGLAGASGPVCDAILKVTATSIQTPRFEASDGSYVQLNRTLTNTWIADCSTWRSGYGSGITSASQGAKAMSQTDYPGPYFLSITKPYQVRLLGNSPSGVSWSVITKAKYL